MHIITEGKTTLVDVSPNDWRFRRWKRHSRKIAELYQETLLWKYGDRMEQCAKHLQFGATENGELILVEADFCRVRLCPICQWRRRLAVQARIFEALPGILKEYSEEEYSWLFLTLSQRNCKPGGLKQQIGKMKKAWLKLSGQEGGKKSKFRERWPAVGALRSLEVTRKLEKDFNFTCHPHFHALRRVKNDSFEEQYRKHEDGIELWQKALGVDYKPTAHIKAIRSDNLHHQISELSKYITKPYLEKNGTIVEIFKPGGEAEYLQTLTQQTLGIRSFEIYGELKKFFKKAPEEESEDLLRIRGDKKGKLTEIRLGFEFDTNLKDYILQNQ